MSQMEGCRAAPQVVRWSVRTGTSCQHQDVTRSLKGRTERTGSGGRLFSSVISTHARPRPFRLHLNHSAMKIKRATRNRAPNVRPTIVLFDSIGSLGDDAEGVGDSEKAGEEMDVDEEEGEGAVGAEVGREDCCEGSEALRATDLEEVKGMTDVRECCVWSLSKVTVFVLGAGRVGRDGRAEMEEEEGANVVEIGSGGSGVVGNKVSTGTTDVASTSDVVVETARTVCRV